jgi:hypothetical protein
MADRAVIMPAAAASACTKRSKLKGFAVEVEVLATRAPTKPTTVSGDAAAAGSRDCLPQGCELLCLDHHDGRATGQQGRPVPVLGGRHSLIEVEAACVVAACEWGPAPQKGARCRTLAHDGVGDVGLAGTALGVGLRSNVADHLHDGRGRLRRCSSRRRLGAPRAIAGEVNVQADGLVALREEVAERFDFGAAARRPDCTSSSVSWQNERRALCAARGRTRGMSRCP